MSGPKRSRYEVSGTAAERLRIQRQQEAEREARRRAESAEKRRVERMETHRNVMLNRHKEVTNQLLATRGKMEAHQFKDLEADSKLLQGQIRTATTDQILDSIEDQLARFTQRARAALSEMSQKAVQAQKVVLRSRLDALATRLSGIVETDAARIDASGYQDMKNSLLAMDQHLESGNLRQAASCDIALERCLSAFEQQYETWTQKTEALRRELAERRASVDAVAQDACVATWRCNEITRMRVDLETADQHLAHGELESAAVVCKRIDEQINTAIVDANAEQLKADQRDYVARSIAGVLEDMGFVVASSAEHAGQPDTSVILSAVNASGQVVAVSVPVDGDVFYDVDGYPMRSEATVDGSVASTCDEAQAVIEDMHRHLAGAYDVKMGELLWEGKSDPDRLLRKADQLPSSSATERGGRA